MRLALYLAMLDPVLKAPSVLLGTKPSPGFHSKFSRWFQLKRGLLHVCFFRAIVESMLESDFLI